MINLLNMKISQIVWFISGVRRKKEDIEMGLPEEDKK